METQSNDVDDSWHIEAVLGPEFTAPISTVYALVDVIVDQKHTSRLVKELQHHSPIPSLRHLKRVCPDGRILIRLADDPTNVKSSSAEISLSKSVSLQDNSCTSISGNCDKDSRKRSFANTLVDHKLFSQNGHNNIKEKELACEKSISFMKRSSFCDETVKRTSVSCEETSCNISGKKSQTSVDKDLYPVGLNTEGLRGRLERVPVPATAPLTRSQFREAQCIWSSNFHPTHSVEAALGPTAGLEAHERKFLLAAMRRCVAAKKIAATECAAALVDPKRGLVVALAVDMRSSHPLQHAAMRLIDLVAHIHGGGVWPQLPCEETVIQSRPQCAVNYVLGYLCTQMDVVMTREPCAMCAMALTHARVHRVFFSDANPQGGVLYSHTSPMHTLPGLNHRLHVYHAPLPHESEKQQLQPSN